MNLDVLAIMAHRDDAEITCGGALIRMADLGYKTGILDLTQGEMGTRGTAEQRAAEADCAAKIMGLAHRENLGIPDAQIEVTQENRLKVASVIRRLRPRVLILPYWEGRHPDHFRTSSLGFEAAFLAGLAKLPIEGEPFRPFKILYTSPMIPAKPSIVIDITDQMDRKMQAIECYRSQFFTDEGGTAIFPPPQELQEIFRSRMRTYGSLIGKGTGGDPGQTCGSPSCDFLAPLL
ncbi:MAG: bacillithiol biosynthesis deacetylase BshB1 [Armatimonadetes bacterium]|nr:bacillithiol biosynthesis deacetylase BshB1 [Armatimonadota bacterium]